jgi:O-antigen ligase
MNKLKQMLNTKYIDNYFLIFFSIIPISIIAGSSILFINIIIIDVSFIILIIYNKNFLFLKSEAIKYLILLYIYLIFNSFISLDQSIGLGRNVGFLRFIILFIAINYFFKDKIFLQKVLNTWLFIIVFVLIDTLKEIIFGNNILGFSGEHGRIVSFFKDEAIVGGYFLGFCFLIIGFLNENYIKKKIVFYF